MKIEYKKNDLKMIVLIFILAFMSFLLGQKFYKLELMKNNSLEKVFLVEKILKDKYLFSKELSDAQILDGALNGITMSTGDPYTQYISEREYEKFKVETEGQFGGIGVNISQNSNKSDDGIVITNIADGKGASLAGLKPDDVIISVDGTKIKGMKMEDAIGLIRGKIGTSVSIEVKRKGQKKPIQVMVQRQAVEVPSVYHKMIDKNIGYINYGTFSKSSITQFDKAINDLQSKKMKSLIIDLRNNGGGLVEASKALGSYFIEKDKTIVEIRSKDKVEIEKASNTKNKLHIPVVILVNGMTASASEIFSGAMQDYKIAKLVGTQTFGKGLVQETVPLDNSSALIVTIAKYHTPNGRDINKEGIKPDFVIENKKEDLLRGIDTQLEFATKILNKK